jgi:hypothetical protein
MQNNYGETLEILKDNVNIDFRDFWNVNWTEVGWQCVWW